MVCLEPWRALVVLVVIALGCRGAQKEPESAAPLPPDTRPAKISSRDHHPFFGTIEPHAISRAFGERGFRMPERFKALVVRVERSAEGRPTFRAFDYLGTSRDRDDWWPASSVKLYAAAVAVEHLSDRGFTPRAMITYYYPKFSTVAESLASLVNKALIPSDNTAFDRLVQLVGMTAFNDRLAELDQPDTYMMRAYSPDNLKHHEYVDPGHGKGSLCLAPPVLVRENAREDYFQDQRTFPADETRCAEHGNCTSLADLATMIARVVLHDSLPEADRLRLTPEGLDLLQGALATRRTRGNGVVDGLAAGLGNPPDLRMYHKAGYANQWFSDAVFVRHPDGREWIVAMAGHPGRDILNDGALLVGRILDANDLE